MHNRPLLSFGHWLDSGSNATVTCRSAENHVEGQLIDPTNSHCVPIADLDFS
jgi:hypothetical protein